MTPERFRGHATAEAMEPVRRALGGEAVLLETVPTPGGGVEIVAAALGPARGGPDDPRIEVVVGLPGDGKTTVVGKLAVVGRLAGRRRRRDRAAHGRRAHPRRHDRDRAVPRGNPCRGGSDCPVVRRARAPVVTAAFGAFALVAPTCAVVTKADCAPWEPIASQIAGHGIAIRAVARSRSVADSLVLVDRAGLARRLLPQPDEPHEPHPAR